MTKKPKDIAKKPAPARKPRIAKETVKDLDTGSVGKDVKGGTTRGAVADKRVAAAGRYC